MGFDGQQPVVHFVRIDLDLLGFFQEKGAECRALQVHVSHTREQPRARTFGLAVECLPAV